MPHPPLSPSPTDPQILPVPPPPGDPACLLAAFRERFQRLPWRAPSPERGPDTLIAPVWSPADSLARFEARINALFTAHLKVLEALATGVGTGARWQEYEAPYRRMRAYCLDWPARELLAAGEAALLDPLLDPEALRRPEAVRWAFGRPDIVLAQEGPRLVETNFDTAIGAFERPDDLWQLAAELCAPGAALLAAGGPVRGLAESFVELAAGEPLLVVWIMKEGEDLRREYAQLLARLDRPALGVVHRMFHAGDEVALPATPRRALLHRACAIYTVNADRARFTQLLTAIGQRVSGCTVPIGLSHLESKLLLAWLSDPDARPTTLSAEELAAITELLPWTRLVKTLSGEELARVCRDRGDFVLKKTDSYQALDVHFGCNLSAEEWTARLTGKRAEPDELAGGINVWIVQERVRPREHHLLEYTDAGLVERRTGLSCCPYVMGGRLRGLETWVTPFSPDHSMIKHMQYVPHFLGPAAPPR